MVIPINEHIFLRTIDLSDAPILFYTITENRNHLRKWVQWIDFIKSENDTKNLIEEGHFEMKKQKSLRMGIFEGQKMKGYIEMQDWDHTLKKVRVGYWLTKEAQGKGLMYKASTIFIDYLFKNLELNKIELVHLPENSRSAALAKKLGFKIEGILRDNIITNGAFKDLIVQGLLKSEFKLM